MLRSTDTENVEKPKMFQVEHPATICYNPQQDWQLTRYALYAKRCILP